MKNQQGQLAPSLEICPVGSREIRWFVECSRTDITSVKTPWEEKGIVWQLRAGHNPEVEGEMERRVLNDSILFSPSCSVKGRTWEKPASLRVLTLTGACCLGLDCGAHRTYAVGNTTAYVYTLDLSNCSSHHYHVTKGYLEQKSGMEPWGMRYQRSRESWGC